MGTRPPKSDPPIEEVSLLQLVLAIRELTQAVHRAATAVEVLVEKERG